MGSKVSVITDYVIFFRLRNILQLRDIHKLRNIFR